MKFPIRELLAALARARQPPPDDIASALQSLPQADALPSPWETWTLICLVRHRQRQSWVADIVQSRLRGSPAELAAQGALGHPQDIPQSGPVPGLPEWEYYFHGRGCCLTRKVDGDSIDVDFYNGSADYFSSFFFEIYLDSLRRPEPPERRQRELHATLATLSISIHDLLSEEALAPLEDRWSQPFRLADDVLSASDNVASFCEAWREPSRRLWLAALVGDWLAAESAAGENANLMAIVRPRAERCRELRRMRLLQATSDPKAASDALYGLADLQAPELDACLERALRGEQSRTACAAVEIIDRQGDSSWCALVDELFRRDDPERGPPDSNLWIACIEFLLRHRYNLRASAEYLSQAPPTTFSKAVLLSLEHAPHLTLALIRKAFARGTPGDRSEVAAILAMIDESWTRRELLAALAASNEQAATAEIRAALCENADPKCREAVIAWEEKNPHESEMGTYVEVDGRRRGPYFSVAEIWLQTRGQALRYDMETLSESVSKFRHIVPPELNAQAGPLFDSYDMETLSESVSKFRRIVPPDPDAQGGPLYD